MATDVQSNFRGAEFVPPEVAAKLRDSTPMYVDIYGLPEGLKDYNGIYKRAAFWNKRAAYRFENSIYTSDDGPYLWWSKNDSSWHLSFWEEAKVQRGANAGGSPLAMLKQDIQNPALHTANWHIAKNYQPGAAKAVSFVYETDPNVKAAQSWKEHVDETEATGFNKVVVVSKSGGVCYSNTNEYQLADGEFESLAAALQVTGKGKLKASAESVQFFGFPGAFAQVNPGDGYKFPIPAGSPAALAQQGWKDAIADGRIWSGSQRVEQDGRTINWRIVVWRLNNFWIVALQNQWKCETAAQKMIKIGAPLVTEGW